MMKIILVLLAIWVILSVLGFVIKGLFWLAIVGVILFVVTAIFGWGKSRSKS